MSRDEESTVLIVEDERGIADLFAEYLNSYTVLTAQTASEALGYLDLEPDVVLLDRMLPERSGAEILEEIRTRGLPSRVAMVTAVDPDFDVLDMGFDDYLVKPVSKSELRRTVDRLLRMREYSRDFQRMFALSSKLSVLEAEKDQAELDSNAEYQKLKRELERLRSRTDEVMSAMGPEDFTPLFHDLGRVRMQS